MVEEKVYSYGNIVVILNFDNNPNKIKIIDPYRDSSNPVFYMDSDLKDYSLSVLKDPNTSPLVGEALSLFNSVIDDEGNFRAYRSSYCFRGSDVSELTLFSDNLWLVYRGNQVIIDRNKYNSKNLEEAMKVTNIDISNTIDEKTIKDFIYNAFYF